ncbi:MAG: hypothetical protein ACI38Y_02060 [Candidatus Methanomethylophilaceae archaeon]
MGPATADHEDPDETMIVKPTPELMDRCLSTGEPISLSGNGHIHAVLLSIGEYG